MWKSLYSNIQSFDFIICTYLLVYTPGLSINERNSRVMVMHIENFTKPHYLVLLMCKSNKKINCLSLIWYCWIFLIFKMMNCDDSFNICIFKKTKIILSFSDIPDIEVIFSDLSHNPICGSFCGGTLGQKEAEIWLNSKLPDSGYLCCM